MLTKPAEALISELQEVSAASTHLEQAIQQHNFLPEDFPRENLQLICASLNGLHLGSLEGCRVPLEYASVRLSEIRRGQFSFSPLDNAERARGDLESPPPLLTRGDALDRL